MIGEEADASAGRASDDEDVNLSFSSLEVDLSGGSHPQRHAFDSGSDSAVVADAISDERRNYLVETRAGCLQFHLTLL